MERGKIQAIEKLRKEMLYKIKETKVTLLAMNDEQLAKEGREPEQEHVELVRDHEVPEQYKSASSWSTR